MKSKEERKVIYVDVSNMTKKEVEKYLKEITEKYKNKNTK